MHRNRGVNSSWGLLTVSLGLSQHDAMLSNTVGLLVLAALTPLGGWLSDRLGYKRVYLFVVGSRITRPRTWRLACSSSQQPCSAARRPSASAPLVANMPTESDIPGHYEDLER